LAILVLRDLLVILGHKVFKVTLGLKDLLDRKVLKDLLDRKVLKDLLDLKDLLVHRVYREILDIKEFREILAPGDSLVPRDMVLLAHKARRDTPVQKGYADILDPWARRVLLENKAPRDLWECRVIRELKVLLVLKGRKEIRESKACKVRVDHRVARGLLDF
jgi:hypothetical protein